MVDQFDTKPFDRSELQKCCSCGKGMMHAGNIHFYEVTIGQCIVDLRAIQQQHGLEMMLEPHELAAAMGFHTVDSTYVFAGTKTQQVKQIGNAVSVAKMEACATAILSDLTRRPSPLPAPDFREAAE